MLFSEMSARASPSIRNQHPDKKARRNPLTWKFLQLDVRALASAQILFRPYAQISRKHAEISSGIETAMPNRITFSETQ
jgi:hypothetical protein